MAVLTTGLTGTGLQGIVRCLTFPRLSLAAGNVWNIFCQEQTQARSVARHISLPSLYKHFSAASLQGAVQEKRIGILHSAQKFPGRSELAFRLMQSFSITRAPAQALTCDIQTPIRSCSVHSSRLAALLGFVVWPHHLQSRA